jgi:hypothetical protein
MQHFAVCGVAPAIVPTQGHGEHRDTGAWISWHCGECRPSYRLLPFDGKAQAYQVTRQYNLVNRFQQSRRNDVNVATALVRRCPCHVHRAGTTPFALFEVDSSGSARKLDNSGA